jgi:hypothetical protein
VAAGCEYIPREDVVRSRIKSKLHRTWRS